MEKRWILVYAGVLVRRVVTTYLIDTRVWAHIRRFLCTTVTFNSDVFKDNFTLFSIIRPT